MNLNEYLFIAIKLKFCLHLNRIMVTGNVALNREHRTLNHLMEMYFQNAANRTLLKINPKYVSSKNANNNNNDNNRSKSVEWQLSELLKAWNFWKMNRN